MPDKGLQLAPSLSRGMGEELHQMEDSGSSVSNPDQDTGSESGGRPSLAPTGK